MTWNELTEAELIKELSCTTIYAHSDVHSARVCVPDMPKKEFYRLVMTASRNRIRCLRIFLRGVK